jgi:molybdopterin synthase catalytic subunit
MMQPQRARITRDVIDINEFIASVSSSANGAIVLFLGVVREQNDERAVRGMRYDAYDEMAVQVLDEIVAEAQAKLGDGMVAAVHRAGELEIGEVSVAIATAAPHRAHTFDAASYVIEEIKKRLPVWKQEHYIEGDARWLPGTVPS